MDKSIKSNSLYIILGLLVTVLILGSYLAAQSLNSGNKSGDEKSVTNSGPSLTNPLAFPPILKTNNSSNTQNQQQNQQQAQQQTSETEDTKTAPKIPTVKADIYGDLQAIESVDITSIEDIYEDDALNDL